MWKDICAVWAAAWADAKENWKLSWEQNKTAIIAFIKAMAGYFLSILQTCIALPLWTGVYKTGSIVVKGLIALITKA